MSLDSQLVEPMTSSEFYKALSGDETRAQIPGGQGEMM